MRTEADAAFEKMLDPIAGSAATRKSVAGIINLLKDDLFGTGGNEMEQRVSPSIGKDFQVGSEDWNDVTFTRQRIRWTKDPQSGPYIEVSQEKAVEELGGDFRRTKHEGRPPTHSCNAYEAQKPPGTDKLSAE